MPSIHSLVLATLAVIATTAVAAPGLPKFPPPFEGSWPGIGARAPAPAPAPIEATGPTTGVADVSFTVDCGCWNMCTLEKVIDKDLVCDLVCDPQFQCVGGLIARNLDAVERDSSAAAKTKRDLESLDKRGGSASVSCTAGGGQVSCTGTATWTF